MDNRRRNHYNPYTFGYQAPLESASISYNPVYDPAETQRMTELLQQRQQRYDVGRQAMSDFEGQVGGMQTYAPDLLNQKLEQFNQKALDLVNNQYGRDYGLAYNDLQGLISKEKSDPFYKFNAAQVKAAEEMRQAKLKDPSRFYEFAGAKDITSPEYLQQALESKNMAAFDEPMYGYAPNTYELAEKQLKNIEANSNDSLFNELSPSEKATLASHGITNTAGLLKSSKNVGISQDRLDRLANSLAESMLNQDPYFMNKYGNREDAKKAALEVVKSASPQFVFNRSQQDVVDLRDKDNSGSNGEYSFRAVTDTPVINESIQNNINDITKAIAEKKLSLTYAENNKDPLSTYWGQTGTKAAGVGALAGEFANEFLRMSGDFPGIEKGVPLTAAALTGLYAGAKNLESKVKIGIARTLTGAGTVEDAKNMINDYIQLNGDIKEIPLTKENTIDYDAYYPIVSEALLNGTAMQGNLLVLGSKDKDGRYNEAVLNEKLESAAPSNFYVKTEDGQEKSINRDDLAEELDLPNNISYKDFKSSIYNPKTGKLQARYVTPEKTYEFEYVDKDITEKLKPIHKIYKGVSEKGYSVVPFNDPEEGQLYLISANITKFDENGKPYVQTYVYHTKDESVKDNIKSSKAARNFIESKVDAKKRPLYDTLENYSGMIFQNIN